ncbi:RICIN domain-containing protein [Polymorphospora sp. NPDC050346]|uniref:RICIN domain-containing protein n=1 Tax=Polymorphospora sp. NPDC050346 TaxID=3155780 RepID=UPI0033C77033
MRKFRSLSIAALIGVMALSIASPAQAEPDSADSSRIAPSGSITATELAAMAADGPAQFHNRRTDKCMDLVGTGAGALGDPVIQYTCNSSTADNQRWYADIYAGGVTFSIRNEKSGLCLDLPGPGAAANGTALIQYTCRPGPTDNQMFQWYGDGKLLNVVSNKCIDVVGPGTGGNSTALVVYNCIDNDDQEWDWWPLSFRAQQAATS